MACIFRKMPGSSKLWGPLLAEVRRGMWCLVRAQPCPKDCHMPLSSKCDGRGVQGSSKLEPKGMEVQCNAVPFASDYHMLR